LLTAAMPPQMAAARKSERAPRIRLVPSAMTILLACNVTSEQRPERIRQDWRNGKAGSGKEVGPALQAGQHLACGKGAPPADP
jgi:hypothetical protein